MVTVDISQLSGECNTWRDSLRSYREELNQFKKQLQHTAGKSLSKEQLHDVEHYHNQFHIQLINIHDLKHAIKHHIAEAQHHPNFGHKIPHHNLELKVKDLSADIGKLLTDFQNFLNS
jgi:benzoyl-CoA reductase/2-hydroxyglutaryl-CoA dehydratase subunit BcrC/BadD/HgdB